MSIESIGATPQKVKKSGIFYGYWIVLAGAILSAINTGAYFYGFSAFFKPIADDLGTTRAGLSGILSLARLEGGLIGPVEGWLIDKFGARKVMLLGVPLMGVGFILLSNVSSIFMFTIVFVFCLSLGSALSSFAPTSAAVANWFDRRRSTMFGIMSAGVGMGGLIVPVVTILIETLGWRTSLVVLGVGIIAIGLPLASVVRHRPEPYGYYPDNEEPVTKTDNPTDQPSGHSEHGQGASDGLTVKEALKTSAFWYMALTFSLRVGTTSAVALHFVPFLTDIGLDIVMAGFVTGAMAVISVVGRLLFGWLGDFLPKRLVVAAGLASLTLGMVALAFSTNVWHVLFALLLYGPSYGGLATMMSAMRAEYFGRRAFATIAGFMGTVMMLGTLSAPIYAGWIFDVTQSYRIAFLSFAGMTVVAIFLILAAKKPVPRTAFGIESV